MQNSHVLHLVSSTAHFASEPALGRGSHPVLLTRLTCIRRSSALEELVASPTWLQFPHK